MLRIESVSNLLPDIQKLFRKAEMFLLLGKKPGDPGWSGFVGILRPKSNKNSRIPVGLHMRCIRYLFNVLYRFVIFFSTSDNCFGKLARSSN